MQIPEYKEDKAAAVFACPAACRSEGIGRKGYRRMHMHSVIGNRGLHSGTAYRMFSSGGTQYRRFLKIAKLEHTDVEHVKQALSLIRSLNPIPANGFRVREKTVFIIPDVYKEKKILRFFWK